MQHLGRFKFVTDSYAQVVDTVAQIHQKIRIKDTAGDDMIYMDFDVNRMRANAPRCG